MAATVMTVEVGTTHRYSSLAENSEAVCAFFWTDTKINWTLCIMTFWFRVTMLWGHYTKSTPHRLKRKNTNFQWLIWSLLGNIWNAFLVSVDSESMKI